MDRAQPCGGCGWGFESLWARPSLDSELTGGLPEWTNGAVSKTAGRKADRGSNPLPSAESNSAGKLDLSLDMSNKIEGIISIAAALFVLISAMFDPRISMTVAVFALVGLGAYHLLKK